MVNALASQECDPGVIPGFGKRSGWWLLGRKGGLTSGMSAYFPTKKYHKNASTGAMERDL